MPRLTASLPKYRKHRASGQAVVTLNGRDHYLGPHGTKTSHLEYDRLVGEWIAGGRQPLADRVPDIVIAELLARYWRHAKLHYVKNGRATGEQDCIKSALRPLKTNYAHTLAKDFGPLALKAVREKMVEEGWTRGFINKSTQRIKRVFRWAVSEQLVPATVYQALASVDGLRKGKTKAADKPPVGPVSDAVFSATLPYLRPETADMARVQRFCGMRPSEVVSIRPMDVDQTVQPWRYVPREHKTEHTGQQRVIFIGPRAQKILAPYLDRAPEENCFGSSRRRTITARVYQCAVVTSLKVANRELAKRAAEQGVEFKPIPHWTPNQLRHATASEVRSKYGLEAAQVLLGHANAKTTEVYAERDLKKAKAVARKIG